MKAPPPFSHRAAKQTTFPCGRQKNTHTTSNFPFHNAKINNTKVPLTDTAIFLLPLYFPLFLFSLVYFFQTKNKSIFIFPFSLSFFAAESYTCHPSCTALKYVPFPIESPRHSLPLCYSHPPSSLNLSYPTYNPKRQNLSASHRIQLASILQKQMPLKLAGGAISALLCLSLTATLFATVGAEDPYRFFEWNVTYGDIYPLGVRQRVCHLNLIR